MTAYAELAPRGVNYRTRLNCACPEGQNRRNGILVVKGDRVVEKLVRCRACTKTGGKEADNGSI